MAWNTTNKNNSRTLVGVEGTFGTLSSNMIDVVLRDGGAMPLGKAARQMLENTDQRRYRHDPVQQVPGLTRGSQVTLGVWLKRIATRLNASATPVAYSHADALSHQIILKLLMGAELAPAAGSTVQALSTTTSVIVGSGHGSRFAVGQIAGFPTANGIEPRRVTAISTDTLTVYPALSATPTENGEVRNAYCYYVSNVTDTETFSVQHAYVEGATTETQRQALGCTASGKLSAKSGEVPAIDIEGTSTTHTAPGDLSLSLAHVADDMGAPFCWAPIVHLASAGTAPAAATIAPDVDLTIPRKWQPLYGSGVQGVAAMAEVASRGENITIAYKGWVGAAEWTAFSSATSRWLMMYVSDGATTGARLAGLYLPNVVPDREPTEMAEGELLYFDGSLRAHRAVDIAATPTPGSTSELAISPAILFLM